MACGTEANACATSGRVRSMPQRNWVIAPSEFRDRIRESSTLPLSDMQIDDAWNAMLIDLPEENISFLKSLKNKYRIFLLSNTNEIHEQAFTALIQKKFGENVLEKVFEKIYFSHRLKLRKPDLSIFNYVLNENNLAAEETLFVDDCPITNPPKEIVAGGLEAIRNYFK